jgi:hypothetical protein
LVGGCLFLGLACQPSSVHRSVALLDAGYGAGDAGSLADASLAVNPLQDAGARVPSLDGGISLKIRGATRPLPYGAAVVDPDALTVTLASRPLPCDVAMYPTRIIDDPERVSLSFRVPPGPGGRFFSGMRAGVPGDLDGVKVADSYFSPEDVTVTLSKFDWRGSTRLTGWADYEHANASARGAFDVPICNNLLDAGGVELAIPVLPVSAPAAPMKGTVRGVPFSLKSAIAVVAHDPKRGSDALFEIDWFASDRVDCDMVPPEPSLPYLLGFEIGGTSSVQDFSGSMQPVSNVAAYADWKAGPGGKRPAEGSGWVQLDALHLQPGDTVSGAAALAFTGGAVSGTFVATVCPEPKR